MEKPLFKGSLATSHVMFGLGVLFMAFDGLSHAFQVQQAVDATVKLGFPSDYLLAIGLIELVCLVLYCIPRTAILGAILLTGYLGGAIAVNMSASQPLFNDIFPVFIGFILWGALYLRDTKVRTIFGQKA
jgi:DoxX-like family